MIQQKSFLNRQKQLYITASVLGILLSIYISYCMRWLGDDIFIALRYVKNFNEGNGMVYNIGEKVEGYTDFLWLMLISLFTCVKFNPEATTEILGIVFSSATLIVFSVIGFKISREKNKFIFPFITLALAFNYDYNVWATSGLEVSFVTFLLSFAFYIYFFSEIQDNKKLIATGFFICLALMTRPDVMVILICANLFLLIHCRCKALSLPETIKILFFFNLAILLIYFPYFIWRYDYYGFIFPNTYYDKLGNESAFSKGFYYIWLYFKCHFTSFLLIIPICLACSMIYKNGLKNIVLNKKYSPLLSALIILLIYLICFVAKVGGDFMYARFIIPIVPFIFYTVFYSLLIMEMRYINLILFSILLLSIIETPLRKAMFLEKTENGSDRVLIPGGIADERYVYLYCMHTDHEKEIGSEMNQQLKGIKYKAVIFGAQARFAYYAGFDYCQEYFGLTDPYIAHTEIKERGRIGHEKHATIEYLESKKIHFAFNAGPLKEDSYRSAEMQFPAGPINLEIITYDSKLVTAITQRLGRNFKYVDFPTYLDTYIATSLPTMNYSKLDEDYTKFVAYYFKNNNDKKRQEIFINRLKILKQ